MVASVARIIKRLPKVAEPDRAMSFRACRGIADTHKLTVMIFIIKKFFLRKFSTTPTTFYLLPTTSYNF